MKNLLVLVALMGLGSLTAQAKNKKEIKLTTITEELVVNVSPEEAWEVINSFGNVGDYHSGIESSKPLNGSDIEGSVGCERQCFIKGKKDILVDERIIEYVDGSHYKYWAESEDFPAKAFYNTFGVKQNKMGQTVIYVITEYRLKPGIMTGLAKGNLRRGDQEALLYYKHYMETGEKNADPEKIKQRYTTS